MSTERGVAVWHVRHEGFPAIVQPESWTGSQENADSYVRAISKVGVSHEVTVGRWFPEAEAAALVDVAEAADTLMRTGRGRSERARIPLLRALDRLDEARR